MASPSAKELEALEQRVTILENNFWHAIQLIDRGFYLMKTDFTALQAAVANVVQNIADVVAAINNPGVDNNDQTVVDELTAKLTNSMSALAPAIQTENAEKGVAPAPTAPAESTTASTEASAPATAEPADTTKDPSAPAA